MSPRVAPGGPSSDRIRVRATPGPNRSIVVSAPDRAALGFPTGTYYICFFAYTPFSALITTNEDKLGKRMDAEDGQIMTQRVAGGGYFYGRYTNSGLASRGTIKVVVEGQDLTSDQAPPLIYYRVCGEGTYEACAMSKEEAAGTVNTTLAGESTSERVRTAIINHEPSDCPVNSDSCTYLIAVKN